MMPNLRWSGPMRDQVPSSAQSLRSFAFISICCGQCAAAQLGR
jgi:hypothetical protein